MRRLGDLSFLVQMYEMAYTSYHTAKRDFNNDQAWMHFAGALVSSPNKFCDLSFSLSASNKYGQFSLAQSLKYYYSASAECIHMQCPL